MVSLVSLIGQYFNSVWGKPQGIPAPAGFAGYRFLLSAGQSAG